MPCLLVLPDAEDELDALYECDDDAASTIDILLDELGNGSIELDSLYRPGDRFKHQPPFEVKKFEHAQRQGKNIFAIRVRARDGALLPYRVLFAYHGQADTYYVLAIFHRDWDYDPASSEYKLLLDRYDECGIPTYRV